MRPAIEDQAQIKSLCELMVLRCDEYMEIIGRPGSGWEADEMKEEIKELYLQISNWTWKN